MTSEEAAAIRKDLAAVYQGLMALIDAIANMTEIVTAIHEECCKDPPPSQIPAALAEMAEAIRALQAQRMSG